MSVKSSNSSISSLLNSLFNLKREERRKSKQSGRGRRNLQMEGLEKREMFAISSIYLSGGAVTAYTDNNATSVTVGQVGTNYRVSEIGTNRYWDFASSAVGRVDFVGGAGNDRFVNNVTNLSTRAWGQGGDDYLEGYNGVDVFVGGDGHDTLVGYGGNDQMWGGNGNDLIRGMAGADYLVGDAGNDHIDGGTENDQMWGGDGEDTLLGGAGDDSLVGDNGNDQLNGQAGNDKMWGGNGDDVVIAIDSLFSEQVEGNDGADTLWVDNLNAGFFTISDNVVGATSADVVQRVQSFANGADTSLDGDNIADPTDIGNKLRFNNTISANSTQGSNPLFARSTTTVYSPIGLSFSFAGGPRSSDINQGALGDCWLLAGLGSVANQSQSLIRQNVVDFNDGTFGVRLGNSFYRVDNELPVASLGGGAVTSNLVNAELGAQNSMWAAIVEKAFTHYRSSANTYASIANGASTEVFSAFRMKNVASKTISTYSSAATMAADLLSKWNAGYALGIGSIGVNTGGTHAFTVERFITNAAGTVTDVVLRNPWATDGLNRFNAFSAANGGTSSTDGIFTVTVAQLFASGGSIRWGQV